jgi:hypothetical protein
MIETIMQWALDHSEKMQIIPVKRLQDIRNEIEVFKKNEDLNGFQQWITTDLYKFNIPDVGFPVRSIILLAIPHPLYANVEFERQAKKYKLLSLVMSDFDHTEKDLRDFLAVNNCHISPAPDLPTVSGSLPSGQLISSAEDMGRYLIAHLNEGRYGESQILSPAGIAELHRPAVDASSMGIKKQYGMGWYIEEQG